MTYFLCPCFTSVWSVITARNSLQSSSPAIGGGVMTSYRFFKIAAMESELYFLPQVLLLRLFKTVNIYLHTIFR